MPKIHLYAEVLTHIRQLTLHASLQTDKGEGPEIHISSDKKIVTVVHDGESSSIYLPTQIQGTADVKFDINKRTELSTRIQIDDVEKWKEPDDAGIEAPWQASDLCSQTVLRCNNCQNDLLPAGAILSWRDLPSQDWADVMDLWFCHKPHEHLDDDERQKLAAEAKGFSSTSKLASAQAVGMVNLASFVLHPDDCSNIKISDRHNENDFKPTTVFCSGCHKIIGSFSFTENLVRLSKSNLSVKTSRDAEFTSFSPSVFVCAQLLSLLDSTPVRKVVVHSAAPKQKVQSDSSLTSEKINEIAATLKRDEQDFSTGHTTIPRSPRFSSVTSYGARNGIGQQVDDGATEYKTPLSEDAATTQTNTTERRNNEEEGHNIRHEVSAAEQSSSSTSTTAPRSPGLLLWIFNPSIYYSSSLHPSSRQTDEPPSRTTTTATTRSSTSNTTESQPHQTTTSSSSSPAPPPRSSSEPSTSTSTSDNPNIQIHAHRASKIFYKYLSDTHSFLSSLSSDDSSTTSATMEDLALPSYQDLENLTATLENSTQILPKGMREFQDWKVGLLDRWERKETVSHVLGENPLARKVTGDHGDGRVTRWELPEGYRELYL